CYRAWGCACSCSHVSSPHYRMEPTMQWVASTALTLASITVATVAAIFSYRQNYGWKPILLVLTHSFFGHDVAWVDFEFWNRRKYPLVVHGVEIKFGNVVLDQPPPTEGKAGDWSTWHNTLCQREHVRLEPASHHLFQPRVPFKKETLGEKETVT